MILVSFFALLVLTLVTGCNFLGSQNSENLIGGHATSVTTGSGNVRFQVIVPGTAITPTIRANVGATVEARLILVFPGPGENPQTTTLTKQVPVNDAGEAQITFSGIPATPVLGQISIDNGSLGGKTDFHGAADVQAGGDTIIEVSPLGSGHPSDVAANVVSSIIAMPEVLRAAPLDLVATIRSTVQTTLNQGLEGPELVSEAVNRFVTTAPLLPIPSLTKVSLTVDGSLQTEPGSAATWTKTADQLWSPISEANGLGLITRRIIRQGLGDGKPPIVLCTDSAWNRYAFAVLATSTGEILHYLLSDGTTLTALSAPIVAPDDDSLVFGALAGGLPVLLRWRATSAGVAAWPISANLFSWGSQFPGLTAEAGFARPPVELISADPSGSGDFLCVVRDPKTKLLREFRVTADGTVTARQPLLGDGPPPPWPLVAVPGSGAVTLHWDAVPTADSYTVYWSLTPEVATSGGDANPIPRAARPFIHTGLHNGTPYHYRLTWTIAGTEQGNSRVASATPFAQPEGTARYTVTYLGNGNTGGSVPIDTVSYAEGALVTVLGDIRALSREGFTFAGWNTAPDGSGSARAPAATFTIGTTHVTLYAQWTALPTFTVTYDGNGHDAGSVPTAPTAYLEGATVTVALNTNLLSKSDRTFLGWNSSAAGNGTTYAPGETFVMGSADVTLYALWHEFAGGSGTASSPYLIANAQQLNNVRNHLAAHFLQTADIDLGVAPWTSGQGWEPIGTFTASLIFTGQYDGNGQKVTNLFCNCPTGDRVGLFGYVTDARIANLTVENADVTGLNMVGLLAGSVQTTTLVNCHSSGRVQALGARSGGLVGAGSSVTLQDSTTTATVLGNTLVGGLIGEVSAYLTASSLLGCQASGAVIGSHTVGGLCGTTGGTSTKVSVISTCRASGSVSGDTHSIGGLIGMNGGYAQILSSSASGNVTALARLDSDTVKDLGGLVGYNYGLIHHSQATGRVDGGFRVGGLVGQNETGSITQCLASGNVTAASDQVGGLVGVNWKDIADSFATGAVTGENSVGGLCGVFQMGTVTRCYAIGLVSGGKDRPDVGGLCGKGGGTIVSSFWDTTTSGITTATGGGTGLPTAQMQMKDTYADWDLDTIWTITEGSSYPTLL